MRIAIAADKETQTIQNQITVRLNELSMKLQLPEGWKEETGTGKLEPYEQLRLLGRRNAEDTFTESISVRVYIRSEKIRQFGSRDALIDHLAKHFPEKAAVEQKPDRSIGSVAAREVFASFIIPRLLHMGGMKNLPIPVSTSVIVLERGGQLVELTCTGDSREFERTRAAFEKLLASLTFP